MSHLVPGSYINSEVGLRISRAILSPFYPPGGRVRTEKRTERLNISARYDGTVGCIMIMVDRSIGSIDPSILLALGFCFVQTHGGTHIRYFYKGCRTCLAAKCDSSASLLSTHQVSSKGDLAGQHVSNHTVLQTQSANSHNFAH